MANTDDNICPICQENYDTELRINTIIPCGHLLCRSCMLDNFKGSTRCPFCRQELKITISKKENKTNKNIFSDKYYIINNQLTVISIYKSILGAILSLFLLIFFL